MARRRGSDRGVHRGSRGEPGEIVLDLPEPKTLAQALRAFLERPDIPVLASLPPLHDGSRFARLSMEPTQLDRHAQVRNYVGRRVGTAC